MRKLEPISPDVERIGKVVLDSAYAVHTALGPGLLESAYEFTLCHELRLRQIPHQSQVTVPIVYREARLDAGFRIDLLVDGCVIVELKAVEEMHPVYHAQLLTYLKLMNLRLGYLINFNVPSLRDGIKRFVR
jgi:GxxExxY protein